MHFFRAASGELQRFWQLCDLEANRCARLRRLFSSLPEASDFFEILLQVFCAGPAKFGARLARSDHPSNGALRGRIIGARHLRARQHSSDRRRIVQVAEDRLKFLQALQERIGTLRLVQG